MVKKVLFFIQNGVGGAERMTVNIAKLLPENDWDVVFVKVSIPFQIQNGRIDDIIPKRFNIINIFWSGQFSFIRQLWKTLRIYQPDIIFSSVMPFNQRLLLLSPFFKSTRFIVRNDNYLFTLSRIKKMAMKYTYKMANRIVAQTEEMKSELEEIGLNSHRICTLHNMLDQETIDIKASADSPFPVDCKIRYVAVGRVVPQKGFDLLIQAFSNVMRKQHNAVLYIVGDYFHPDSIKEYQKICRLIGEYKLEGKVKFIGYTDNPYRYIKNADVFVLSSRYEGLPNVLVEAQYLKTPAAAFECIPMISRMISNGVNGYLAENGNPDSLASAMISASQMKEIRQFYKPSTSEDFLNLFYKE